MKTYSTFSLFFASFIGFAVFLMFAWQEWQKLTKTKMSLFRFIADDQAGFLCAVLLTVASYIALPELGSIEWLRERAGFTPDKTPFSAMTLSFLFSVLGYQLRAIGLDWLLARLSRLFGTAKNGS